MLIPGEIITKNNEVLELNAGYTTLCIKVENHGDRPIQIGSHYHFYEVNSALIFDRNQTYGYRLDIMPGTSVRFEPGQTRKINLVSVRGKREIYGFHGNVQGKLIR